MTGEKLKEPKKSSNWKSSMDSRVGGLFASIAVLALAFKPGNVSQVKGLNPWRLSREFEER
jgi:hypothetical protein